MNDDEALKFAENTGITNNGIIENLYSLRNSFVEVGTFHSLLVLLRRDLCLGGSVKETSKIDVKDAGSHLSAFELKRQHT
jgi:hypothetical protein